MLALCHKKREFGSKLALWKALVTCCYEIQRAGVS